MTPNQRKATLVLNDVRMSEIARTLGVSRNHVSRVVAGDRRSPTVEAAIAGAIGKPLRSVFPPAPVRLRQSA